jgi:hypothetical protein
MIILNIIILFAFAGVLSINLFKRPNPIKCDDPVTNTWLGNFYKIFWFIFIGSLMNAICNILFLIFG